MGSDFKMATHPYLPIITPWWRRNFPVFFFSLWCLVYFLRRTNDRNTFWQIDHDYVLWQELPKKANRLGAILSVHFVFDHINTVASVLWITGYAACCCLCLVVLRSIHHAELLAWRWKNQVRTSFSPLSLSSLLSPLTTLPGQTDRELNARVVINTSCRKQNRKTDGGGSRRDSGREVTVRSPFGVTQGYVSRRTRAEVKCV